MPACCGPPWSGRSTARASRPASRPTRFSCEPNSAEPAAWQTVFHFHLHVIPRYEGDPLKLPWVPGPGDMDEIKATGAELAGG